jgi:radical SAM superfamily enzyme
LKKIYGQVREQRGCVIMELLQTERDYKQNLTVCANIFLKNPQEAKDNGIDLNLLFGNLEEIIEVSTHLIQLLEESTLCKKYEHQRVGKCFLQIADEMKHAYSQYCKNHDEIQPLWQKYEGLHRL